MKFGEQLEVWRAKAGLTGAELERRIGKSRGYVARLISGDLGPTEEVCTELGKVFEATGIGVTTADVMAVAVPEAAGEWVKKWYEARIEREVSEWGQRMELALAEISKLHNQIRQLEHEHQDKQVGPLTPGLRQLVRNVRRIEADAPGALVPLLNLLDDAFPYTLRGRHSEEKRPNPGVVVLRAYAARRARTDASNEEKPTLLDLAVLASTIAEPQAVDDPRFAELPMNDQPFSARDVLAQVMMAMPEEEARSKLQELTELVQRDDPATPEATQAKTRKGRKAKETPDASE